MGSGAGKMVTTRAARGILRRPASRFDLQFPRPIVNCVLATLWPSHGDGGKEKLIRRAATARNKSPARAGGSEPKQPCARRRLRPCDQCRSAGGRRHKNRPAAATIAHFETRKA